MSNTYKQPGNIIAFVAGSTIVSGQLVAVGDRVGVAAVDIASGATGSVHVDGVHEVAKASPLAITQGATLYFDATEGELTTSTDGAGSLVNAAAGYAFAAAGSSDTTVLVKLNG